MGFEPTTPVSQGNRLAGGRTRPLCDPSIVGGTDNYYIFYYITTLCFAQIYLEVLSTLPPLSPLLERRGDWSYKRGEASLWLSLSIFQEEREEC